MFLTKRLRAGILLYALFMAAVFALFLQFYVGRLKASHQVRQALYHQTQASLMAELTKVQAENASGSYQFDQGSTSYQRKSDQLLVTVQLQSGQSYRFDYFVKAKESDEGEEDKEGKRQPVGQTDQAKLEEVVPSRVAEKSPTAPDQESPSLGSSQSESTETAQPASDERHP